MIYFSSRQKIALLLSGIISFFLILVFASVITINHYDWQYSVKTEISHEIAEFLDERSQAEDDDDDDDNNEDIIDQDNYYIADIYGNGESSGIFRDNVFLKKVLASDQEKILMEYNGAFYPDVQTFFIFKQKLSSGEIFYAENISEHIAYERNLISIAIVSILIFVFLSWFVGLFAGKIILKPLRKLMDQVKLADLGKTPKNIIVSGRSDDEIVELSRILQNSFEKIENSYKRISDFNHNISHELKNPLAIIRTDIELAILKKDLKKLSKTLEELKYLDEIINKLLFIAEDAKRISLKDFKIEQIRKIIENVSKSLDEHYQAKKNKFKLEIKEVNKLKIDQDLFKELIFNLLENAYKYSKNGEISFYLDNKKMIIKNKTEAKINQDIQKIFEPFFKLESARNTSGYGIGLSVVKKICEVFQWEIAVKYKNQEIQFQITF